MIGRQNFRTTLSCHYLHYRLPFFDYLMGHKTLIIFYIFYWFLNIVFIHHILNINILIANLTEREKKKKNLLASIKEKVLQTTLLTAHWAGGRIFYLLVFSYLSFPISIYLLFLLLLVYCLTL